MARPLPPLNGLRAFEAAARHLSFTRAAAELHVTQAAVSHQIKALELHLGLALFRRLNRSLKLTEEGETLFPSVSQAFEILADATQRLYGQLSTGVLTVSVLHSFAAGWLVPRLVRFRALHPEIDVHLATSEHLVDFTRESVDVAIRYGIGRWPPLNAERLWTEELFPVCSPALLETGPALRRPQDLRHFTLLHDDMREDWRMWLMAADVTHIDPTRGPAFRNSNLVIQAAVAGEGVALGRSVLVADPLADGRLIKPFDISLPAHHAYYVVCPETSLSRPKVKAFRDWLLSEPGDGA